MSEHRFLVLKGGKAGQKSRDHMILDDDWHAPVRGVRNAMIGGAIGWAIVIALAAVAWWGMVQ